MPNLYLIKYIFFPLIPCLTAFILGELRNSVKLSLYGLIFIYILSLISLYFCSYLIFITVFIEPERYEIFWNKFWAFILPKPILLDSIDGWELFTPPPHVGHSYNVSGSVYNFASAARVIAREWHSILFAISELDLKKPHPSGTTRLSAFQGHLSDLAYEAKRLDLLARRRFYRNIVMNTPAFTMNDNSDVESSDSSYSSDDD